MKKKLLLIASMIAVIACLFAISVSAEDKIIKLDTCPTLEEIHANPEAYVSHLDAFDGDSYGELDSESVVVLCDSNDPKVAPTYYYVFPSYYYARNTNNTIYNRLTMLNEAIAAADPTAFANYNATDGNWGSGSCKYLVRYEMPTYVTAITKTTKFEYATNLKEIYFPTKTVVDEETGEEKVITCVTWIEGQNTFTGCSNLETIGNFDKLPTTIYNNGAFSGCSKLTGITLHEGITSIPGGMFSGCKKLNNVTIPYGVVSIGDSAFYDCDSITEIILPNTVTSISKLSFASMDNLEIINFGAGLANLYSRDHNLEVLTGCTKLKYVYMPASFATTVQNTGYSILATASSTVTIFFTGTKSEAEAIRDKLPESGNTLMYKSEYVEYDPSIDYTTYAETLGYAILVYNYDFCKAFYGGEHVMTGDSVVNVNSYLEEITVCNVCTRQGCGNKVVLETIDALFVSKGYSVKTFGDGVGISQGYEVNTDAVKAYKAYAPSFDFGIIAYANKGGEAVSPVPGKGGAIDVSFDNMANDYIEVQIMGIPENSYDVPVVFCIYTVVNGKYTYISNGTEGESVIGISYNEAVK